MNDVANNNDFSAEEKLPPAVAASAPAPQPDLRQMSKDEYDSILRGTQTREIVDAEIIGETPAARDPVLYSYGDFGGMARNVHNYFSTRLEDTQDPAQKKQIEANREAALGMIHHANEYLKGVERDKYIEERLRILGELKAQKSFDEPELQRIIEEEEQRELAQTRVQKMTGGQMLFEVLAGGLSSMFGKKSLTGNAFRDMFSESVFRGNLVDVKSLSKRLVDNALDSDWMAEHGRRVMDDLQRKMANIDNAVQNNPQNFANTQDIRNTMDGVKKNIEEAYNKTADKAMMEQLREAAKKIIESIMKMFDRKNKMVPGL